MKQKVVIKTLMKDQKSRTKAIKTAVGVDGVIGATLMQEEDQIEIIGEGIDVVLLTCLLRKGMKHADVVSVSDVDEQKEEQNFQIQPFMWQYGTSVPHCQVYTYPNTHCYQDPSCNIM